MRTSFGSARFYIEYKQIEPRVRLDVPTLADPTVRALTPTRVRALRPFFHLKRFWHPLTTRVYPHPLPSDRNCLSYYSDRVSDSWRFTFWDPRFVNGFNDAPHVPLLVHMATQGDGIHCQRKGNTSGEPPRAPTGFGLQRSETLDLEYLYLWILGVLSGMTLSCPRTLGRIWKDGDASRT